MTPERVTDNLYRIEFVIGQAYLWTEPGGLTLVDTGPAGSGAVIADAIRGLGRRTDELRHIILTHFHDDHAGAAAEIAAWHGTPVLAHRAEAPVIRGEVPGPPPQFTHEERELHARITAGGLPQAPPCRVDRELENDDSVEFGGGTRILATPGHTDGSIAVHLPAARVLFTGDTAAHVEGRVVPGVFNLDTPTTLASYRMLAALDVDVACFGHGVPVTHGASVAMRAVLAG